MLDRVAHYDVLCVMIPISLIPPSVIAVLGFIESVVPVPPWDVFRHYKLGWPDQGNIQSTFVSRC